MARIPEQVYRRLPRRMPNEWKWSNHALRFSGLGNYVEAPDDPSLTNYTSYTLEAWIRWESLQTDNFAHIINKEWYFRFGVGRVSGLAMINYYDGGAWRGLRSLSTIPYDKWVHLVGVVEAVGANSNMYLYINGELNNSGPFAGHPAFNARALRIGCHDAVNERFKGRINEVRILDRAIGLEEVRESLRRGYARVEGGSVLNLRFEEGVGLTAYDESGYGNHGSLRPVLDPPTWEKVSQYELLAEA